MLSKLLESIEIVSQFIKDKGLFHSLSTMTQENSIVLFSNEESKKEQEKFLEMINKNLITIKRLIEKEDFRENWLNLSRKEKISIIFHHSDVYKLLRQKLQRKDIVLTSISDYVFKESPKELFELCNLNLVAMPKNEQELNLFKEEIKKKYQVEESVWSKINIFNVDSLFKKVVEKYCMSNAYEVERIMKEKNLISGFIIFILHYQDRVENSMQNHETNFTKIHENL